MRATLSGVCARLVYRISCWGVVDVENFVSRHLCSVIVLVSLFQERGDGRCMAWVMMLRGVHVRVSWRSLASAVADHTVLYMPRYLAQLRRSSWSCCYRLYITGTRNFVSYVARIDAFAYGGSGDVVTFGKRRCERCVVC